MSATAAEITRVVKTAMRSGKRFHHPGVHVQPCYTRAALTALLGKTRVRSDVCVYSAAAIQNIVTEILLHAFAKRAAKDTRVSITARDIRIAFKKNPHLLNLLPATSRDMAVMGAGYDRTESSVRKPAAVYKSRKLSKAARAAKME